MASSFLSKWFKLPARVAEPSFKLSAEQAEQTHIARALRPLLAEQAEHLSGIYPLDDADEAFAARMLMARHAERSLDVQYYIWQADMTGLMLLEELHAAADRGVQVRLLLDDNNSAALEPYLWAMDAHPNIEVRLFNPFVLRRPRWMGFLTDFSRVNRRMHNKSFTADASITVVGGRNIGDSYFGADDDVLFADLDVLTIGAAVADVAKDFDRYWNSESAYPLKTIMCSSKQESLAGLASRADEIFKSNEACCYLESLRESDLIQSLLDGHLQFEWACVRMVSDDPAKVLGKARPEHIVVTQLQEAIGNPAQEVELVSPYFVPAETGVDMFAALVAQGVAVKVLTNSLVATDVAAVHSGYGKRRKALLEAGVELYEMRPTHSKTRLEKRNEKRRRRGRLPGSSGTSLHAKTFSVDGRQVFVGSFNFDPRSALLNTELGFVIESERLAKRISASFMERVPQLAYRVRLDAKGRLFWEERNGDTLVTYRREPQVGWVKRMIVRMLALLPLDALL